MPRPRPFRTEAVVLRQRPIGDADRICVLFAPSHGRIEAVARGARKPSSRLAGHIHALSRAQFELAEGRSMYVVTGAQTLDAWPSLHDDVDRLAEAAAIAELVDRTSEAGVSVRPLYALLAHALSELSTLVEGASPSAVRRWFVLRWLDLTGYQPELDDCVRCRRKLEAEGCGFAPEEGGAVCPQCLRGGVGSAMSSGVFKLLRYMRRSTCAATAQVQLSASASVELERHLRGALEQALEGRLRSAAFTQSLAQASDTARRATAEGEVRHAAL